MRILTVSSLYRESGELHRKNECVVPSIRLNGKWLAALGVVPGQKIRVITNGATITLAPISFESGELISIERAQIRCPAALNPAAGKPSSSSPR
jgi:Fe2+ transport system protein FeoA